MAKVPNRPTPEGIAFGKEVARLVEPSIIALEAVGVPDSRCKSCAFRDGTVPNGCLPTLGDAMKCVFGGDTDFLCHEDLTRQKLCHGFVAARWGMEDKPGVVMPWNYSNESEDTKP